MRIPRAPHRWDLSPKRAVALQRELAGRVRSEKPRRAIRYVAGLDVAFSSTWKDPDGSCIAGVVLWDRVEQTVVEEHVVWRPLTFPYVPGLLSFREVPALLAALRKLRREPDAILCDGHGLAHPRRFGLACHVGVLADRPTVGCAKSRLCGVHAEPDTRRGSTTPLWHDDEVVASVLRTRDGVKPVFVSVGHRIDPAGAVQLALDCATGYRLPEPTRLADRLVAASKRASGSRPHGARG